MGTLLQSGNLLGLAGLLLLVIAGYRLMQRNKPAGALIIIGSSCLLLTRIFSLFFAPQLTQKIFMELSRVQIALLQEGPPFAILIGFLFVVFGILFLKMPSRTTS